MLSKRETRKETEAKKKEWLTETRTSQSLKGIFGFHSSALKNLKANKKVLFTDVCD